MPEFVPANSAIVAQAFRHIGRAAISSLGDDSQEAEAAREQYPRAVKYCLEKCDWSFASTRRMLTTAAVDPFPDPDLPWLFTIPGDVVTIREVAQGTKWRIDRDGLRADVPAPLYVRYTGEVQDETKTTTAFQDAVALRLALLLAPYWSVTEGRIQAIESQLRDTLKDAAREDSRSASEGRYDDQSDQGDWAAEARL